MNKQIITEITISAPRERVWEVLTDYSAYPDWNPFIRKIEGELKKGARLRNTLQNGDKTITFKPTIIELKTGETFAWLGHLFVKGLFDGLHNFTIKDAGNGQVRLVHAEKFSGMLGGLILKKVGAATRENFIRMNEALKKRAESQ